VRPAARRSSSLRRVDFRGCGAAPAAAAPGLPPWELGLCALLAASLDLTSVCCGGAGPFQAPPGAAAAAWFAAAVCGAGRCAASAQAAAAGAAAAAAALLAAGMSGGDLQRDAEAASADLDSAERLCGSDWGSTHLGTAGQAVTPG
jgi:hypothetical protein